MTTNAELDRFDLIAIEAARSGLAVHAGRLRDDERCRQQQADAAAGIYEVMVDRNRYGWYVRPRSNLINNGMRISPNFATEAEALDWATRHIAEAPDRRSLHVPPVIVETFTVVPFMGRAGGFVVNIDRSHGQRGSQSPRFETQAEAEAWMARYRK